MRISAMPIFSTASSVSLSPAVSTTCTGTPSISMVSRIASRVVPGISVTIAVSSPVSRFNRLDLPTLGCPTSTTRMPSRNKLPCEADISTFSTCACITSSLPWISPCPTNSISSSGKSMEASTSMRRVIRASTRPCTALEKSPCRDRMAHRAASPVLASIMSATLSACARSSLLLRNARKVNSPGWARRAPAERQLDNSSFITAGPP